LDLAMKVIDDCLIVQVTGELDMHTAPVFKEKVTKTMDKQNLDNLILDFKMISFIDSSGLGAILGRYRSLKKKGGQIALVHLKPQIRKIFSLAGLLKIMDLYGSEKEAIKTINEGGFEFE
jgi:stage II sporulation protein AA (anti-sigma F factor antagonist)